MQFKWGERKGNSEMDLRQNGGSGDSLGLRCQPSWSLLAGVAACGLARGAHSAAATCSGCTPLAADTYAKKDQSKGYNALALYDVANCWMRQAGWGTARLGAALGSTRRRGGDRTVTGVTVYQPPGHKVPLMGANALNAYRRSRLWTQTSESG